MLFRLYIGEVTTHLFLKRKRFYGCAPFARTGQSQRQRAQSSNTSQLRRKRVRAQPGGSPDPARPGAPSARTGHCIGQRAQSTKNLHTSSEVGPGTARQQPRPSASRSALCANGTLYRAASTKHQKPAHIVGSGSGLSPAQPRVDRWGRIVYNIRIVDSCRLST